ncbi:MAG TPA: acyl carrier protein [Kofleriaceae bacterium]
MTEAVQPVIHAEASLREKEIQDWLTLSISRLIHVDPSDLDVNVSFDRYGLDSAAAVELTGDLERWLGRKLTPTLFYDYLTIRAVSAYLAVAG